MTGFGPGLDPAALFAPLAGYRSWGLAVSGGPDSLALLLLAHRWVNAAPQPPRLIVYSVDHGLRAEAAGEAGMVAHQAKRLGLPVRVLRWEGQKPVTGRQEAARRARYRLIGEAMRADGAEVLLTGHHLGDQAETVLMRMAHGSGIGGLRGMDPLSEVEGVLVARPLLGVGAEELRRLVGEAGMVAVNDPGNADPCYERVRWRQALPALAALGLDARRLGRLAQRLGEADQALAEMAGQAFAELVRADAGRETLRLDRLQFSALPAAIAVRVLARALGQVGDWRRPRALAAVEGLAERLRLGQIIRGATLHGCVVRAGAEYIRVGKEGPRTAARRATRRNVAPAGSINR